MLDSLEKRILLTLVYSSQFSQALRTDELYLRLIGGASQQAFTQAVLSLSAKNIIYLAKNHWFLAKSVTNKQQNALLALRLSRLQYSLEKKRQLESFLEFARHIPWIEAVAITGSVAVENAVQDDDTDIFIVTQKHRLWLVRILCIVFAFFKNKRRTFSGEEKNSWCFNLWLEVDRLKIAQKQRSLYTAYEVLQADWVFDVGNVERQFLQQNNWARQYLPQLFLQKKRSAKAVTTQENTFSPFSFFVDFCAVGAYWLQFLYMWSHKTTEKVGFSHAFFHPRDTGLQIRSQLVQLVHWAVAAQPPSIEVISIQLQAMRKKGKKVVLVTGVFDLLHEQHILFLSKAKKQGDVLVVGVESDVRVRQIKGEGRPVVGQLQRVAAILDQRIADLVFILPEQFGTPQDHIQLITALQPNILAVSSHTAHLEKKQKVMDLVEGLVVVVHQHEPSISTTKLLAQQE